MAIVSEFIYELKMILNKISAEFFMDSLLI